MKLITHCPKCGKLFSLPLPEDTSEADATRIARNMTCADHQRQAIIQNLIERFTAPIDWTQPMPCTFRNAAPLLAMAERNGFKPVRTQCVAGGYIITFEAVLPSANQNASGSILSAKPHGIGGSLAPEGKGISL